MRSVFVMAPRRDFQNCVRSAPAAGRPSIAANAQNAGETQLRHHDQSGVARIAQYDTEPFQTDRVEKGKFGLVGSMATLSAGPIRANLEGQHEY